MTESDNREVPAGSVAPATSLEMLPRVWECSDDGPDCEQYKLIPGPQLFIDDYLIEKSEGLTRTVHQPEKLPEPVISGHDWYQQTKTHFKVVYDPDLRRFRMWFCGRSRKAGPNEKAADTDYVAYAESDDGIDWHEPELGLIEVNGSKKNNAVADRADNLVLIDHGPDWPEPQMRYIMVYIGRRYRPTPTAWRRRTFLARYSADGLHFVDHPSNPVYIATSRRLSGRLSGFWDPLRRRYLLTIGWEAGTEDGYRDGPPDKWEGFRGVMGQTSSPDLLHWSPVRRIVTSDPEEPELEQFGLMRPTVRGGLYLAFTGIRREDLPLNSEVPAGLNKLTNTGNPVRINWTELCTSRDGENWIRQPGIFLNRNSTPGTWDHAQAGVTESISFGDKDYVYYDGSDEGYRTGKIAIGLAMLRRDGFVSLDAGAGGGVLRTRLLYLEVSVQIRVA